MASITTLPRSEQIYNTFGRWVYVLPSPSTMSAAPTVNTAADLGTVVVVPSTNSAYVLVSSSAAGFVWQEITAGGGAAPGNFTTLTATGATNLNVGTANVFNVLTGASSGNVHINDGTGTGTITIGNAAAGAVTVQSGALALLEGATAEVASTAAGATAINIDSSANAAGGTTVSVGTGGLHMANQATATTIDLGNVIPTVGRTTVINGGLLGSAIADVLSLGNGGVNFAGSTRTVNVGSGPVTIGTNIVAIGNGAVGATGINDITIGNGAITAGGVTAVTIGGASAGSSTLVATPATNTAVGGSGLGIQCGAGAVVNILAGAGDPTGSAIAPKGSLYIKTDAAGVADRLWIATAANTWTFFTANA